MKPQQFRNTGIGMFFLTLIEPMFWNSPIPSHEDRIFSAIGFLIAVVCFGFAAVLDNDDRL